MRKNFYETIIAFQFCSFNTKPICSQKLITSSHYFSQLKRGCDFVSVLDVYYKVHKIFGLKFPDESNQLLAFMDHYIYLDRDAKCMPSTSTIRMAAKLLE